MSAAIDQTSRRIPNRERLIFALDVPDLDGAKDLVARLGDSVVFYKIGLELATSRHYFELLDWLIGQDKKVFADLKLYDIPATVSAAVNGQAIAISQPRGQFQVPWTAGPVTSFTAQARDAAGNAGPVVSWP